MKINLGCGKDWRHGYLNIDKHPVDMTNVRQGDFRNIGGLGIQDNSAEEILGIDILSYIPIQELQKVLQSWYAKLAPGGIFNFQNNDGQPIANMLAYAQLPIEQINTLLFGQPEEKERYVAVYTLPFLEYMLRAIGMKVIAKGISGTSFYIKAQKPNV